MLVDNNSRENKTKKVREESFRSKKFGSSLQDKRRRKKKKKSRLINRSIFD